MTTEERLLRYLAAPPAVQARLDAVLAGQVDAPTPPPARLITHGEAARRLAVSRPTVWRMENDGTLPVVEIRPGTFRVPEAAVESIIAGAGRRPNRRKGGAA